ncbi:MAG: AAA family ATPase [Deltaproteobacteria bacterium]|jgi:general secretion pathway protein A|nr:AAA family ATPase [Deltaproteobacteria bacterium]
MYKTFFGFKEHPFNLTPDPRYLYLSRYHREALDHLLYGINQRKGFIAITGGVGTGKTTLCRALLDHLDDTTKSALIFSSFVSDMEILKSIAHEFGVTVPGETESKNALLDAINHFLLRVFREGGNALLLIDEAQNLSRTVLEQIRMLSNLETEKDKLIQIVLVGQSELKEVLSGHSLRQLDDRITVRYHLKPLDQEDVRGYVEHRLVVAGGKGDVRFSHGAFKRIYSYSGGNPRRINAVCDRALLLAYTAEKRAVSGKMTARAILDLRGGIDTDGNRPPGSGQGQWWKWVLPAVLFFMIAAGFGVWTFRDHLFGSRSIVTSENRPTVPVAQKPAPTLLLTNKQSIAGLFDLVEGSISPEDDHGSIQMSLVSFPLSAEYYTLLKMPFRIDTPVSMHRGPSAYLLIHHATPEGAVALDADGNPRNLTRDFILEHWGGQVSWVYPYADNRFFLSQGMQSPAVLTLQEILQGLGYLVTPNGFFDQRTCEEVKNFQNEFGLKADGVVGSRTLALLYQMADKQHELHP